MNSFVVHSTVHFVNYLLRETSNDDCSCGEVRVPRQSFGLSGPQGLQQPLSMAVLAVRFKKAVYAPVDVPAVLQCPRGAIEA